MCVCASQVFAIKSVNVLVCANLFAQCQITSVFGATAVAASLKPRFTGGNDKNKIK